MSTDYYLDCKLHKMAVHFTDNKSNGPNDKELLRMFLICHGFYSYRCEVRLESEHTIEFDRCKDFKKEAMEIEEQVKKELGGI
ncbi:hypothetical protein LCGC14_1334650 [marine sediment metagenome]|uniref:Uncharacterized protein n=1 Tax=marine sediment metagenome TaxID=412755 RepID=A0A0F9NHZ9_9ZZZZ|nr:hypothetical protein [Desulfobacterales bacterium]